MKKQNYHIVGNIKTGEESLFLIATPYKKKLLVDATTLVNDIFVSI